MFELVFPLMAGAQGLFDAASGGMMLIMGSFLFLMLLVMVPAMARVIWYH